MVSLGIKAHVRLFASLRSQIHSLVHLASLRSPSTPVNKVSIIIITINASLVQVYVHKKEKEKE
jgi:hypothetical protein